MTRITRIVRIALVAAAGIAAAFAFAPPRPSAAAEGHIEKAARLVEKLGYPERLRTLVRADIERKAKGDPKKTEELMAKVDWKPLLAFLAERVREQVDEATLDEVLPYLDTPEGKRQAALLRVHGSLLPLDLLMAVGPRDANRRLDTMMREFEEAMEKATGSVPGLRNDSNETSAIATLRNMASCQAQIQTSGKIDCDNDGIGEYGTFLEMTGSAGVRKGFDPGGGGSGASSDFSTRGSPVNPPIMSPALANVDADGVVTKAGYCFRILLPDTGNPAGFTHETGPAAQASLAGGTGKVLVDLAETTWCAYAWPVERERTGTRVFFVNQYGDVMQSANESGWSGPDNGPPGNAAFYRGAGITGRVAVGTRGGDGDVWKVTN